LRTCAQRTKYKDHCRNSCYALDDGHNNPFRRTYFAWRTIDIWGT
jgi:hypothetical protein